MYLVSYDISSNKIRKKVSDTLANYGQRVQYSVFECNISAKMFKKLYSELVTATLDKTEVSIRIYQLDKSDERLLRIIGDPGFIVPDLDDVVFL